MTKGDRVRLNAEGRALPIRKANRTRLGTIVSREVRDGCVWVQWDGLVSRQSWAVSDLERVG